MTWRINPTTKDAEEIATRPGDIWQDGRDWHLSTPSGWNLITARTKSRCLAWRNTFIQAGEDWGDDYNPVRRAS